jgi:hypothetical protein
LRLSRALAQLANDLRRRLLDHDAGVLDSDSGDARDDRTWVDEEP